MEKTLEVKLPAELEQKARALAEEEGTTLPEVVQQYLEKYVEKLPKKKPTGTKSRPKKSKALEKDMAILAEMQKLAQKIGEVAPSGLQAMDVLNEMRR